MKCFITNRECIYDRPNKGEDRKKIFFISPFGFPFDDLYDHAIQPYVENNMKEYDIARADQSLQLGYVMCHRICRRIISSSFVFADLSMPNGNVYYELGLACGLGKEIGIIKKKDSDNAYVGAFSKNSMVEYGEIIERKIYEYDSLYDLLEGSVLKDSYQNPYHPPKLCNNAYSLVGESSIEMESPTILNFMNNDGPGMDLHEFAINKAMNYENDMPSIFPNTIDEKRLFENWRIDSIIVDRSLDVKEAFCKIIAAKICVFDMTHYKDPVNAYMFFLLGLAHALEREAVPVINRPKNLSMPFDIRGLWQVNFDEITDLERELRQIIGTIDADVKKQKTTRLYREMWDPFLREKCLHVFTCAREGSAEQRRIRTNIDKWDFMAVSELSFFIAQMYETVEVKAEKPRNKVNKYELDDKEKLNRLHNEIREEIYDKSCVIVGSPDVSDYAEIILADLHDIKPHSPGQDESKLPFLFYKKTVIDDHPRRNSSFYKDPSDDKDKVVFDSNMVELVESKYDKDGERRSKGETCIVITIAKNPHQSNRIKPKMVMILSGYTGVGTYGSIKFLTDQADVFCGQLKDFIRKKNDVIIREDSGSVIGYHILLMVSYESKYDDSSGDTRELKSINLHAVKCIK